MFLFDRLIDLKRTKW